MSEDEEVSESPGREEAVNDTGGKDNVMRTYLPCVPWAIPSPLIRDTARVITTLSVLT